MPKVQPKTDVIDDEVTTNAEVVMEDDDLLPSTPIKFTDMGTGETANTDDDSDPIHQNDGESAVAVRANPMAFDANPVFDQSEVDIPRLRLLQGLSQEVQDGSGRPGHWILPGYESKDVVTFVPVGMIRNREYANAERVIQCHSNDAIQGIGNPGIVCAECPLSSWVPKNDGSGKNNPPPCSMIFVYLGVVLEYDELCIIKFQKTQTATAKWFNSMATTRGGFGKFAVSLQSAAQQGNNGKFYIPKPSIAQIPPEVLKKARLLALPPAV